MQRPEYDYQCLLSDRGYHSFNHIPEINAVKAVTPDIKTVKVSQCLTL
jgi:hypothetical protein